MDIKSGLLKSSIISFIMAVLVASCNKTEHTSNSITVSRIDKCLAKYPKMDSVDRANVRSQYSVELNALADVVGMPDISDSTLMIWSNSLAVDMFSPMVDSTFTNVTELENTIALIYDLAESDTLSIPHRRVATVVWGKPESIIFTDSVMLVALNHWLGADSPAYQGWPEYRRKIKRPEMLPYDVTEASIATAYPYSLPADKRTILSRMIYEGVLIEAKMRVVDNALLHNAMGFSEEQYNDLLANRAFMWQSLVGGKMLFSTDGRLADELFSLLPASAPISPDAPGRAVRLCGYEVVKAYLKKYPATTLRQMLSPEFYGNPDVLRKSGYAPTE